MHNKYFGSYFKYTFLMLEHFHLKRLTNCTLFRSLYLIKESFPHRPIWPLPPSFGPLENFEVPTLKSRLPLLD